MVKESSLTKSYYRSGEIGKLIGRTQRTVYNYFQKGVLKMQYTDTNRLLASRGDVVEFLDYLGMLERDLAESKHDIVYVRVSSQDQKSQGDLDGQVAGIVSKVPDLRNPLVIKDVASGLNDKRKGLNKLFSLVENGEVARVFVSHRDRLTRFGFSYIDRFFTYMGVQLVVLDTTENRQELVDDMMDLLASLSGRFYGLRSSKKRQAREVLEEVAD